MLLFVEFHFVVSSMLVRCIMYEFNVGSLVVVNLVRRNCPYIHLRLVFCEITALLLFLSLSTGRGECVQRGGVDFNI